MGVDTIILFALAAVVTLTTSLLKLPWLSSKIKLTIATMVSTLAAIGYVFVTGDFEAVELLPTALQILGLSQLLYKFVLDDKTLDNKLERVGVSKNYDDTQ